MKNLTSFLAGLFFAIGLGISGMMNPKKVRDFLDITNVWDPALLFVMVSAVVVYAIAFRSVTKREKPICEKNFSLPTKKSIDAKLIIGAALFGVGWGLAGICPGPALANLATGLGSAFIFVMVMLLSMHVIKLLEGRS